MERNFLHLILGIAMTISSNSYARQTIEDRDACSYIPPKLHLIVINEENGRARYKKPYSNIAVDKILYENNVIEAKAKAKEWRMNVITEAYNGLVEGRFTKGYAFFSGGDIDPDINAYLGPVLNIFVKNKKNEKESHFHSPLPNEWIEQ